jgi:hypothetical protein
MFMQVNRYIFHNTATTSTQWPALATIRSFLELRQAALPCTTMKEGKACTLYGFEANARRKSISAPAHTITSSNSYEETDNDALENQFRLNITYPWIAHRGVE